MTQPINICTRCILPSSFPGIYYNSNGECNFCSMWDKNWRYINYRKKAGELERFLGFFRGKGKPYDCLIGLSGGTDSSYVVYLAKKWGMNPLTVCFDNGFLSDNAKANIKALTENLSVPHIFDSLDRKLVKSMYLHFFLTAGEFCSVCNIGIDTVLRKTAQAYKIKLILYGYSPRTEAMVAPEFFTCSTEYFNNVCGNKFPKNDKENMSYASSQKSTQGLLSLFHPGLFIVRVPDFVPWDDNEIVETLKQHGLKFDLFDQHSDCKMNDTKEYLKLKKFGVLEKCSKLSSLIRDGQITRDEALRLNQQKEVSILSKEQEFLGKIKENFDISEKQLHNAIKTMNYCYIPKEMPRHKNFRAISLAILRRILRLISYLNPVVRYYRKMSK